MVLVAVVILLIIAAYLFKIKGIILVWCLGKGAGQLSYSSPSGFDRQVGLRNAWMVPESCLSVLDTRTVPGNLKTQGFNFWQEKKGCFSNKKGCQEGSGHKSSVSQPFLCPSRGWMDSACRNEAIICLAQQKKPLAPLGAWQGFLSFCKTLLGVNNTEE